jgi:chromosome segregation protein
LKLRQIKLAGFKTFVDQTTIKLDGQLAGIVGPNGCGKSNIMESVKWVLGSSSAKEMRGESMESVIFDGTDTRQPIGRASVELFFDNSEGIAPAEWSSYAEISVKRVIEREKGSTYLINNTVVRRKDVADLFLGTGLGAKGYAIIGQNTISQIVEAKPEELKNYLEEAAGVSKYKERRKETEYRLRDTRDNLERVNDLLREINGQITKLESQAQTAKKHNDLKEKLKLIQAQIYLVKKQLASKTWEGTKNTVNTIFIKLDKHKAELTHIESEAEDARQSHIQASDAININQAKFYETNSAVTDVENKLNNLNEKIVRLSQLKENSQIKFQEYETLGTQLASQLTDSNKDLNTNQARLSQLNDELEATKAAFMTAEKVFKQAEEEWTESTSKLQELTEQFNIENATIELSEDIIKDLNTRIELLSQELKALKVAKVDVQKPEQLLNAEKKRSGC